MIGGWVEQAGGGFVNLDLIKVVAPAEPSTGVFVLNADSFRLAGTYASLVDAQAAARQLVHGVTAA